ncbi:GHMP kinase [Rubrobacter indicoceani]|uniref:GHMP family kinase ATP-binding protein n=1 Tax=Rubrobacter indicoceani TaxID=2051957 RepID=UPI000E5C2E47|nr:GHMP kinase [Rubrobacter indicoceani]
MLQGAFRVGEGLRRGLVTLPMPGCGSRATFRPAGSEGIDIIAPGRSEASVQKVRRAVAEGLSRWGGTVSGGELGICGGVPAGRGMGSSTSEVVAVLRAVAAAFGVQPSGKELAAATARSESASDPLMLDLARGTPLFDPVSCRVLAALDLPLPALEVVGFDPGGPEVPTDKLGRAEYSSAELKALDGLFQSLWRAVRSGDPRGLGRVATGSARINQRFLYRSELEEVISLAEGFGAVGVAVAHSGTVAGVLFDASEPAGRDGSDAVAGRLSDFGGEVFRFETGDVSGENLGELG